MAQRRLAPLLFAVLALLAVGVAALWLLTGGEPPDAQLTAAPDRADTRTPGGQAEIAAPRAKLDAVPSTVRVVRTGEDDAPSALDLSTARWVEGRLALPPGAPLDEGLTVVALGENVERIEAGLHVLDFYAGMGQRSWDEREVHARVPVAADGTFRVPFPGGPAGDGSTEVALLDVDGLFLFMKEPMRLDLATLGDDVVVLEPVVGGAIRGVLRLPRGHDETPGKATVGGFSFSMDGSETLRVDRLEDALEFELRALRPAREYSLFADVDVYANAMHMEGTFVEPGRLVEVNLQLTPGATVRGTVVDPEGARLADATVVAEGRSTFPFGGGPHATSTDAEGRFELRGLLPGEVQLQASAREHLATRPDPLELTDGQVVEDLEISLEKGLELRGTVRWPDGAAAVGARMTVLPRKGGWRRFEAAGAEEPPVATSNDGTFRVVGLEPGAHAIHAALEPRDADGEAASFWSARLESVEAGTLDVVLTLRAPLALVGRVLDDVGAPLEAFAVHAERVDWPSWSGEGSAKVQRSFTERGGRLELGDLDAGAWKVTISADGHVSPPAVELSVPSAQPAEFVLTRTAQVSGVVLDPGGRPVAGADVQGTALPNEQPQGQDGGTQTDAEGRFTLASVGPGSVELAATSEDWAPSGTTPLGLLPGMQHANVVLTLTTGGAIAGIVYDDAGLPQTGREIIAQSQGGNGGNVQSDAGGRFLLEHLTPATYQVIAVPDPSLFMRGAGEEPDMGDIFNSIEMASATVVEGETVEVVLGAPPRAPVVVHGRVSRGGDPVPRANLMVMAEGGGLLERMRGDTADEGGNYEVRLDEPGDYTFVVMRSSGGSGEVEFQLTIPEVDRHRVDLAIPGGSIAGRVRGSGAGTPEGARVWFRREDGTSELSGLMGQSSVQVEEDGSFVLADLHPGQYAVTASASGTGSRTLHGIRVRADEATTGIELVLGEAGTVSGRVVDEAGQGVENAAVFLRDAGGQPIHRPTGRTDGAGEFSIGGVSAGDVTVSARTATHAAPDTERVRVVSGEETRVELELAAGTVLRIALEDDEGDLVRAAIRVQDADGLDHAAHATMDELERVLAEGFSSTERRVGPLPPGSYTISASAPDGRSARKTVTLRGQEDRKVRLRLRD